MDELELVTAAKEGNQEAMAELYEMHLGMLKYHAAKQPKYSVLSFEDVMSVGREAFMESIHTYSPEGKLSFGMWMGGRIFHDVKTEWIKARYSKLSASTHVLWRVHGIKGEKDVGQEKFTNAANEYLSTSVIDGDIIPELDFNGASIMDNAWDGKEEPFRDANTVRKLVDSLPTISQGVPSIQKKVVELYMMDYKWSEIGDMLSVSKQAAQQSFAKAVKGMRRELNVVLG